LRLGSAGAGRPLCILIIVQGLRTYERKGGVAKGGVYVCGCEMGWVQALGKCSFG